MKRIFWKFYDAAAHEGAGGDATAKVLGAIEGMKANMVTKAQVEEIAGDKIKAAVEPVSAQVQELKQSFNELNEKAGTIMINTGAKQEVKTFKQIMSEAVEKNFKDIANVKKGSPFTLEISLKEVGDMTTSNVTGDTVINYGRNAILPATKTNMRDLIPTSNSSTLVQAYYREGAGEGSVAAQTEGSAKSQLDIDFTEVNVVNDYIAGYVRYTKQLNKSLPFMQSTLPRILLRRFYDAENSIFFAAVAAAATGSTTTSETDDVKAIIDYIANQRTAKYAASYGLVSHNQLARLNKLTYTNGYYAASGGVVTNADGSMVISGVPIVPVDWATDDKILIIDRDYLERVEGESLKIEFFEQDGNNVTENKITARIECLEEINPMMPASMIYADLGNVS